MNNIIIGGVFVAIIIFAAKKTLEDMKKGKCAGCSGCSGKKVDKNKNLKGLL